MELITKIKEFREKVGMKQSELAELVNVRWETIVSIKIKAREIKLYQERKKMIKVVAFDLVGVLVNEKDIKLSEVEEKLEKMFGPNLNDFDYLIEARKIIKKDSEIMNITYTLIDKLYKVKNKEIFKKIKEIDEDVKVIIATNHLSFIRSYIRKSFNVDYLDDVIISAEIHKIKPNSDFYEYILNKYNITPNELLFLDDTFDNLSKAKQLGINAIKVTKGTNLFTMISKLIKKKKDVLWKKERLL